MSAGFGRMARGVLGSDRVRHRWGRSQKSIADRKWRRACTQNNGKPNLNHGGTFKMVDGSGRVHGAGLSLSRRMVVE